MAISIELKSALFGKGLRLLCTSRWICRAGRACFRRLDGVPEVLNHSSGCRPVRSGLGGKPVNGLGLVEGIDAAGAVQNRDGLIAVVAKPVTQGRISRLLAKQERRLGWRTSAAAVPLAGAAPRTGWSNFPACRTPWR